MVGKIYLNMKFTSSLHHFPSTNMHLGKKSVLNKLNNITVLKECPIFFILTDPTNTKIDKASYELVLKNYNLQHCIRSFIWFILINLKSITFDYLVSHADTTGVELGEIFQCLKRKRNEKKEKNKHHLKQGFPNSIERQENIKF